MTDPATLDRYARIPYRRVGHSGLKLPALSLGLWHNFGDDTPIERQRAMLHTAFDAGITHFDLANNYGTPYGSAELNFGRLLKQDFHAHRDEFIISTKAGWDMWAGPYGQGGGSRKHLLASLHQSLRRLGVDYVDIFYSHRFDPDTPLEETARALATAVRQGKALYVGVSSGYTPELTREFAALLAREGVSLLVHQPAYNLLHRDIEHGLLDSLSAQGVGAVVFSPLAQGVLTGKYADGVPEDSRIGRGSRHLHREQIVPGVAARVAALAGIAQARGQTLAQFALAWTLRDPRVSSVLVGASRPAQILENLEALRAPAFSSEELAAIDKALD
jgi:L-glyceraldehyde 3-phosphate reductase